MTMGLRPLLWAGAVALGSLAFPVAASAQVNIYSNNFDGGDPTAGFQSIAAGMGGPGSFQGSVEGVDDYGGGVGPFGVNNANIPVNAVGGPVSGTFGGNFLRNATTNTGGPDGFNPLRPTTLKVDGLGSHSRVSFKFLLAIIDSWDATGLPDGVDRFRIRIGDGVNGNGSLVNDRTILDRSVGSRGGNSRGPIDANSGINATYDPMNPSTYDPNRVGSDFLTWGLRPEAGNNATHYGLNTQNGNAGTWNLFGGGHGDDAFDMGTLTALQNVAHSASTLAVSFEAWSPSGGNGIQGRSDESWAIDNLDITYNGDPLGVPEPGSIALFVPGAIGLLGILRKRRKA